MPVPDKQAQMSAIRDFCFCLNEVLSEKSKFLCEGENISHDLMYSKEIVIVDVDWTTNIKSYQLNATHMSTTRS